MKKRFLQMLLLVLMGVVGNIMSAVAQTPEPTGQWKFDNPDDLMEATVGSMKLIPAVIGSSSASVATVEEAGITAAEGVNGGNAILLPATSALKVERVEGATSSMSFSLMIDMKVPDAYSYDCLFQTNTNNSNDGEVFIHERKIGAGALGGYVGSIWDDVWYRVVLTNSNGYVKLYVNGEKLINFETSNTRWEIDPVFYLFADDDGEKSDTYVSEVAFWETPLTDEQVSEMGGISGLDWITDVSQINEGDQYYIISDRIKYAGTSTGQPKAMACLQSDFPINWGDHYVYWGDLDMEADGFIWTAEKVGDQLAFLNKEKGMYLGNMNTNPVESDVVFSETPVGYTLTDLTEGAGRFFMTNEESVHSPHVQGYLRNDRADNSLAKQNVGDDDYPGDGATYGYPGRWKLLKVTPDNEEPSDYFNVADGYYNIIYANSSEKKCWTDLKADAPAYELGASLILDNMHNGDPRSIYRIEAVDRKNGLYNIRSYATGKYVSGSMTQDLVCMADDAEEPLLFLKNSSDGKKFSIYNTEGVMFTPVAGTPYTHIGTEGVLVEQWKVQKVDAASLESPSAQLKLALAKKLDELGHPDFTDHSNLSEEQLQAYRNLWEKADKDLAEGVYDIIYESDIRNLEAAAKGEYKEPVYDKFQKEPLRVLSYNVRHCAGNKDGLNLPRTASVIAAQQADVVALQEVDSVFSSRSNYKYQVKELAEATGMYGIFCSALTGYGIGILSKELPLSIRVVSLTPDFEPRRMLIAEFNNYVFASLHVGLNASARRGTGPVILAEAERWVEKGKPLIIAGDFNDDGTDDEMQGARGVLTEYLQQHGFTYHSDLTTPTWSDGIYVIDHIISYDPIGGVEKVSYEVVNDKVTSDHMPILGDFIIGFDDPTGIETVTDKDSATANGKVYRIDGTAVSGSADGLTLPGGIYIFNGKKVLR